MNGLAYLLVKTTQNKIKKSLKKPGTYIWIIFSIAYVVMVVASLGPLINSLQLGNPQGFTLVASLGIFFFLPANIITYAKRKGLVFKQSEVHFVFTTPINPKLILMYAKIKQILLALLLNLIMAAIGVIYFHLPVIQMILYFILAFVVEAILESSLTILLFGNETLSKRQLTLLCRSLYLIIAVLLGFGAYLFITYKASWEVIQLFLSHPVVQCVPIIGWNIAFIRLIFLGPTVLNVIGTILYCFTTYVLFVLAYKMKCGGEYYEDAMQFADSYAVRLEKNKNGQIGLPFKQKLNKATIVYKGKYAKAIFYRQLLEYKKNRFFIFGLVSLVNLIVGVAIAVFGYYNYEEMKELSAFVIPGVSAYITFIFSGYTTKWSKEISHPYTFLIPDSAARKLWYATLIEHIRAGVDGALLTLPGAIFLRLNLFQIILSILIYMCLQANKLYLNVVTDVLMQRFLGTVGKQMFRVFMQGIIIAICAMSAIIGGVFLGLEVGYIFMIIISVAITALLAIIASKSFENMESME